MNVNELIIIGGGPAGYTAALYASRGNLEPLVFEGFEHGGQLMITVLEALEHQRLEVAAGGVQGGRVARGATTDDDQLVHVHGVWVLLCLRTALRRNLNPHYPKTLGRPPAFPPPGARRGTTPRTARTTPPPSAANRPKNQPTGSPQYGQ